MAKFDPVPNRHINVDGLKARLHRAIVEIAGRLCVDDAEKEGDAKGAV